jgi:cytochrome c biogenesis protein CcmG/thiol:disulfide interchange protein DsbE
VKRLLYIVPLALFGFVVAAFAIGLHHDPGKLQSTLIGKKLPQFNLPAVRAGDVGLKSADFRGHPMLLNVYASWCISCRIEHPTLLALKAGGVTIQGLDWKDDAADGARYLAEHGDPYTLTGNDASGRTGIDLGVAGVPETFVVDANGVVRYKFIGPIEPQDWTDTIEPILERLKAQS